MSRDWTTFCKDCGQCCGVFPIPNDIFAAHQGKAQRPYSLIETEGHVIAVTDDGYCIFLDSDKRCAIYADRPGLCRLYGEIPNPYMQCSRLRGEPDEFIGEAMSAPLNANRYKPKGVLQKG